MARTNEDDRELQVVLGYMLNKTTGISNREMYEALGIARNTYHNRSQEDDFPNAEECRLVARFFDLNPVKLMVVFGLIDDEDVQSYVDSPAQARRVTTPGSSKLVDLSRRNDVPSV